MSEQSFLDMANDFKEIVKMKDSLINKLKSKLIDSRKDIIIGYVLIRLLDNKTSELPLCNTHVKEQIEIIRGYFSDALDKFLLEDVGGVTDIES